MRFESLFADPGHVRGDARMIMTAIRRGWVRPEDRPALVARLMAALDEHEHLDTDKRANVRQWLALVRVALEMNRDNTRALRRVWTGGKPGRPRERRR